MKLLWQDREWELDASDASLLETKAIRAHMGGMPVDKWLETLIDMKGPQWEDAFQALYWLMLCQNGQHPATIAEVDFPLFRFAKAFQDQVKPDEAAAGGEAEPDPTTPSRPASEPSPARSSQSPTSTTGPEVSQDG